MISPLVSGLVVFAVVALVVFAGFMGLRVGDRRGYVRGLVEGVDAYLLELARRWKSGRESFALFNRALRDRSERDNRPITVIGTIGRARQHALLRETLRMKQRNVR